MKYLILLAMLLSLCSCSKPQEETIIETTNTEAIIQASTNDTISISSNDKEYILNEDEKRQLIQQINALEITNSTLDGYPNPDYPIITIQVNDSEYQISGDYLINSYATGSINGQDIQSSTLYHDLNLFLFGEINSYLQDAINNEQLPIITENLAPELKDEEIKSKLNQLFIKNYNQFIEKEFPYSDLHEINLTSISDLTEWDTIYYFQNDWGIKGIEATQTLNDYYAIKYTCSISEENKADCSGTYYINDAYLLSHTEEVDLTDKYVFLAENARTVEGYYHLLQEGVVADILKFDGISNNDANQTKTEANEANDTTPMYYKILTILDYPITNKEDIFNLFNQTLTKDKSRNYVNKLFDSKRFIEKEDGVYMNINSYNMGGDGGYISCNPCQLSKTDELITLYLKFEYFDLYTNDPYSRYYAFKLIQEDGNWKY